MTTDSPFSHHRLTPRRLISVGRALRQLQARGPRIGDYSPTSTLEMTGHEPTRACVAAVDFHTHLGTWLTEHGEWMEPDVEALLDIMDAGNLSCVVNLDGRWGPELEANLDRYDRAHPDRFVTFCHVDWQLLNEPDGPDRLAKSLYDSVDRGARGLKIWKDLGFEVEVAGRRILPDDPLLSPLWEAAGALGVPVLIHVADPVAFFRPVDRHNERLEQLLRYPSNSRSAGLREFHRLIDSVEHVLARHPGTTVVAAHGYYPENLQRVAALFDRYPNFFIDIAWVHHQLGRQPRAARALLTRYNDRVLFGSDGFPVRAALLRKYFRFLETDDEAFAYSDDANQTFGRWAISGLGLDRRSLERIYRGNAQRILDLP